MSSQESPNWGFLFHPESLRLPGSASVGGVGVGLPQPVTEAVFWLNPRAQGRAPESRSSFGGAGGSRNLRRGGEEKIPPQQRRGFEVGRGDGRREQMGKAPPIPSSAALLMARGIFVLLFQTPAGAARKAALHLGFNSLGTLLTLFPPFFSPLFPLAPGVVPQSAPPVPTASSRFHFPPLDSHSPTEDAQPGRFSGPSLVPSNPEALGDGGERKPELPELEDGSSDWRRGVDLMASRNAVGAGGINHQKRKPEIMLPLFTRPGIYPDPHSPFAVSPLPGRGGVLNVPISPALSLTPTLFSYSPSPGLSPFTGSSCFSFNPEEMKHYLHSQACSVFNYHLSPRTFPRYPGLVVPPLQCQMPLEEQPQFPIKLQPPPVGRKNRERLESAEESATPQLASPPPRVKVEPSVDKEAEREEPPAKGKDKNEKEEGSGMAAAPGVGLEEEKGPVFARPAAPSWHPTPPTSSQAAFPAEEPQEQGESSGEKAPREPAGEPGAQEKREDALMPPKLRLKRRWNGDRQADPPEERPNGRLHWHGALGSPHLAAGPKAVAAAAASDA